MTRTLPDRTVPQMLDERVAASPGVTAFCTEAADGSWTPVSWRDFKAQADRLAAGLLRRGLHKGDRLALIAPVSLEWELLHHAALRSGIVVVGLDAHDLPERIAAMCDTADITAVATTAPGLLRALRPERMQRLRCVVTLPGSDTAAPPGLTVQPLDRLCEANAPAIFDAPLPAPGDTATIIFTSGTTGAPKGIAYTQAQLCLAIDAISEAFPFVGPGSHLLCWLPLSNLFQRMVNLAGMRRGAASYLLGDPRRVMDVVATVAPDVFIGVPRFYEKLYQGIQARIRALPPLQRKLTRLAWKTAACACACKLEGRPTPLGLGLAHRLLDRAVLSRIRQAMGGRLHCMVTGSAPTPPYLLREFHAIGWLLLECYGMSENVLPMAMNRVGDFCFGTVGRPLPGNDLRIASDGVVVVRGPGVFAGYLNGNTPPTPPQQAGFTTGDIGFIDEHGYLQLQGRRDDVVKTSTGLKIELPALEAVLRSAPGISDAVMIAKGKPYPTAICIAEFDTSDSRLALEFERHLNEVLLEVPAAKRPRAVFLGDSAFSVATGELTSNLKIRRETIETRYSKEIDLMYRQSIAAQSAGPRILRKDDAAQPAHAPNGPRRHEPA